LCFENGGPSNRPNSIFVGAVVVAMVVTEVVVIAVAVIHGTTSLLFPLQNIPMDTSHYLGVGGLTEQQ
jgi:hypothetical protein